MAAYFLDTSATVKRYVAERGHQWMDSLFHAIDEPVLTIAQVTNVETVAALCQKARSPDIQQRLSLADRDRAIFLFRGDVRRRYDVIQTTAALLVQAGDLCRIHALRAYDAVQLASAIVGRNALAHLNLALAFVNADRHLLAVAVLEGLPTEDPNDYP